MTDPRERPIVLVGPMGAGKSTVGRRLAHARRVEFRDSDDEIEALVAMRIPQIFASFGEPHFRTLERAVVHHLLARGDAAVIALGGGAFVQDEVRRLCVHYDAVTVYLETSPEQSWARVGDDDHRPLLDVDEPVVRLRELLASRREFYAQATLTVSTDDLTPKAIVDAICHAL